MRNGGMPVELKKMRNCPAWADLGSPPHAVSIRRDAAGQGTSSMTRFGFGVHISGCLRGASSWAHRRCRAPGELGLRVLAAQGRKQEPGERDDKLAPGGDNPAVSRRRTEAGAGAGGATYYMSTTA
jgi:hypothetical protein